MPKVIEIVTEYLKANGLDGLANSDDECGCFLDDLAPCGEMREWCVAGRKAVIDGDEVCLEDNNFIVRNGLKDHQIAALANAVAADET